MPSVRIKLNKKNVRLIARSDKMLDIVTDRAETIRDAAGEGFTVDSRVGKNRARASVRTSSREAREAEAVDRALTRAIDAAKGSS